LPYLLHSCPQPPWTGARVAGGGRSGPPAPPAEGGAHPKERNEVQHPGKRSDRVAPRPGGAKRQRRPPPHRSRGQRRRAKARRQLKGGEASRPDRTERPGNASGDFCGNVDCQSKMRILPPPQATKRTSNHNRSKNHCVDRRQHFAQLSIDV